MMREGASDPAKSILKSPSYNPSSQGAPLVSETTEDSTSPLRRLETFPHDVASFAPRGEGFDLFSTVHILNSILLFPRPSKNPRLQRHLRELWIYRKPRTQNNLESHILNLRRPCTSHSRLSHHSESLPSGSVTWRPSPRFPADPGTHLVGRSPRAGH